MSNLAGFPRDGHRLLDDLHRLSNAELIADLGALVALLPDNVHLVLSTRVDPPIAWSRHRLLRGITEIRQAELAFDSADSSRLLERITGRPLASDCVRALVDRTEGWAAGLQLAGMMLRLHGDSERFVAQFSGSDRLIADYLSEEVLHALPASRRRLLLHVSVLDEMNCRSGELPDRRARRPAGARGPGTGVDVPGPPGRPPRVVPFPPPVPGSPPLPPPGRGPRGRGPPAGPGGRLASPTRTDKPRGRLPHPGPAVAGGARPHHGPWIRGVRARADDHGHPLDR